MAKAATSLIVGFIRVLRARAYLWTENKIVHRQVPRRRTAGGRSRREDRGCGCRKEARPDPASTPRSGFRTPVIWAIHKMPNRNPPAGAGGFRGTRWFVLRAA